MQASVQAVKDYLLDLQNRICAIAESHESDGTRFFQDEWQREGGGGGLTRVLEGGQVFEKAGVNFSHITGDQLPPAATAQRPELAGCSFEAMGVSVVMHPHNPYVPTSHANVRLFVAHPPQGESIWWFGGGFDLTPYYVFEDDVLAWHKTAQQACRPFDETFGQDIYSAFKQRCDDYFYLKHRHETRGVGGLFFDDLNEASFDDCFGLMRSIGDAYMQAYDPIISKRKTLPYGEREKDFQLYRRGRYVEFNLVFDRGTLFGLQSGGRTESILMSLPAHVHWRYNWQPEEGSEEAKLQQYLQPRDWLSSL